MRKFSRGHAAACRVALLLLGLLCWSAASCSEEGQPETSNDRSSQPDPNGTPYADGKLSLDTTGDGNEFAFNGDNEPSLPPEYPRGRLSEEHQPLDEDIEDSDELYRINEYEKEYSDPVDGSTAFLDGQMSLNFQPQDQENTPVENKTLGEPKESKLLDFGTFDEQNSSLPLSGDKNRETPDGMALVVSHLGEEAARLVDTISSVEEMLSKFQNQKKECERTTMALKQKMSSSMAHLEEIQGAVDAASNALVAARDSALSQFQAEMETTSQKITMSVLTRKQQEIVASQAKLKKTQEATAQDLRLLNASYLSLENSMQEQLRKVLSATEEASAASYAQFSDHLNHLLNGEMEKLQRALNNRKVDDLAAERAIADCVKQLKSKGVAVLDISDIFNQHNFDVARKEFMARVAVRIKAFFLPIFIVTQTNPDFSDWLFSRYHVIPTIRLVEEAIDELTFVNDPGAYVVIRIENVLTETVLRNTRLPGVRNNEEGYTISTPSHGLPEGRLLPYISQPSQEALLMARSPFFGWEVTKRFEPITKGDLQKTVGNLAGRAVLLVYVGDRKGEIPRPTAGKDEVLQKLEVARKFISSFSTPVPEVAALWRQMEAEVAFYSIFFKGNPLVIDHIIVSTSFESGKLPPMPPSPLFMDELGVVQLQVQRDGADWLLPSSRALFAVIDYANSHFEKGGVQVILQVEINKVKGFWRTSKECGFKGWIRKPDGRSKPLVLSADRTRGNSGGEHVSCKDIPVFQSEVHVKQYLKHILVKTVIPAISPRAAFKRLLLHVCEAAVTCN